MKRHLIGICVFLSIIVFVTSCMEKDEIVHSDFVSIASENIIFGGGSIEDNIILTRSGETATHKTMVSKRVLMSESDKDVSLPVIVEVQQGIHTSFAYETKAAITADKESITELDAWCIYTDTDGARKLYFADMAEADRSKGAPFAKESDGIFYPKAGYGPYLWLKNSDNEFNFYNVTPTGSGFEANINLANNAVTFNYTVPQNAQDHKDILVASPAPVPGNFGQSVPLTFKHVMAAVNVKVGNQVPTGIIKSIKFTGVYNKASYFPDSNEWTNRTIENGGEFNVILPQTEGFPVVGEGDNKTPDKTPITTETTSFMMIPQQLFTGAEIVVDFLPDGRTEPLTLRASIQGDIWEMNTTTNYLINIDPSYNLSIVPQDNILDSHYIMTRVEVSSEYPLWSVSVTANDNAEVTVQKESELNELARQGFWTDKYVTKINGEYVIDQNSTEKCRGGVSTGGSTSTEMLVVFIPENITGNTRTITLTLIGYNADLVPQTSKTVVLKQNSVKWLNPTGNDAADYDSYWGCELLIENGPIKWGFCWDNLTATFILRQGGSSYDKDNDEYSEGQIPKGQDKKIKPAMELAGIDVNRMLNDTNYYIRVAEGGTKSDYYIRVDLSKINLNVAENLENGWQNTFDVYHFEGISSLRQLIDFCNSWGDITNPDGRATNIQEGLDYAVMYAMKRNRFYYYTEYIPDVGQNMTVPVIYDKDLNWYLPAKDQFPILMQSNWGQQFSWNDLFWTSTVPHASETDNAHAYAYLNGVESIAHRNDPYLTFALRRYSTSSDVTIPINPGDVVKPGEGNGPEHGEGGEGGGNTGGDVEGNT